MKVVTQPYDALAVPLSVAQRASILVTARNDTEADQHDWPLFANMNPEMFDKVRAISTGFDPVILKDPYLGAR